VAAEQAEQAGVGDRHSIHHHHHIFQPTTPPFTYPSQPQSPPSHRHPSPHRPIAHRPIAHRSQPTLPRPSILIFILLSSRTPSRALGAHADPICLSSHNKSQGLPGSCLPVCQAALPSCCSASASRLWPWSPPAPSTQHPSTQPASSSTPTTSILRIPRSTAPQTTPTLSTSPPPGFFSPNPAPVSTHLAHHLVRIPYRYPSTLTLPIHPYVRLSIPPHTISPRSQPARTTSPRSLRTQLDYPAYSPVCSHLPPGIFTPNPRPSDC
jgi:hypothetical protein